MRALSLTTPSTSSHGQSALRPYSSLFLMVHSEFTYQLEKVLQPKLRSTTT